jgi:hypothetical protein
MRQRNGRPATTCPAARVVARVRLLAAIVAVAGLSIDAYVHLNLAATYAEAQRPSARESCPAPRRCCRRPWH